MSQVGQAIEAKLTAPLLASAVRGVYTVTTTGDLIVNITSHAPRTILVTSLTILWDDNTTTTLDRWNNTATANIQLTITHPDGTTETLQGLPAPLAPGDTLTIVFQGYAASRQPITISASLSASPIVAVIPVTPPTPAANITPTPQAQLLAQLNHTAYSWTVTWSGEALVKLKLQAEANLISSQQLTSQPQYVALEKLTNNTIYAESFSSNVFGLGTWDTIGGDWSYTEEGLHGGAINQSLINTTDGFGSTSGEYIAYPIGLNSLSNYQSYYVLAHVYLPQYNDQYHYHDIVIFNNPEEQRYLLTLSILRNVTGYYIEVWEWSSEQWWWRQWNNLISVSCNGIYGNEWYISLARVNVVSNVVYFYVYDVNGSDLLCSGSALPTYFSLSDLNFAGVGTWNASAVFDDFIVSRANPLFLNFTVYYDGSALADAVVEVVDGEGNVVARGVTDSSGFVSLNVGWEPIIENAVIHVYSGSVGLDLSVPVNRTGFYDSFCGGYALCGGEHYVLDIGFVGVERVYDIPVDPDNIVDIVLSYVFSSDTAGYYNVKVLDSTGSPIVVDKGYVEAGETVSGSVSLSSLGISASDVLANGRLTVQLVFYPYSAGSLNVSRFDASYTYYNSSFVQTLVVGVGGSNYLEVYVLQNGTLEYLYTVETPFVFNGSTVISYDRLHDELVVFTYNGTYVAPISPDATFTLVTADCWARGPNVALEVVNTSTASYAVALRVYVNISGTVVSRQYCIVNLSSGSIISYGRVGSDIVLFKSYIYVTSAALDNGSKAFFLVYNTTAAQPEIVLFNVSDLEWYPNAAPPPPGSYSVGLAWGGGKLWLLLERGGLYYWAPGEDKWNQISISLPFYPWGPGDRLEYISGLGLVFVRDDGTREVWLIPA